MRILIIDDSAIYRKILKDVLSSISDVEEIFTASNGIVGLDKIEKLKPDAITLDVEMPKMDGLEVLRHIKAMKSSSQVIMVSAHTTDGAEVAIKALELGALDIVGKPDEQDREKAKASLKTQLSRILSGVIVRKILYSPKLKDSRPPISKPTVPDPSLNVNSASSLASTAANIRKRMQSIEQACSPEICAIGGSTGGPAALTTIISSLPENFPLPCVCVLHMPPVFTAQMAKTLNMKSKLTVTEAIDGMPIKSKMVYLAPGGKQMKVVSHKKGAPKILRITDDPPENNCKPSVDYLFRSVAEVYGGKSLGVILTGMGTDGAKGMLLMKERGATTIAQDKQSCIVFGMPMEAIKMGVVDIISPLRDIVQHLDKVISAGVNLC